MWNIPSFFRRSEPSGTVSGREDVLCDPMDGVEHSVVRSSIPGRLRLEYASLVRNTDAALRLEARLSEEPAIRSIRVRAICGSILLFYDTCRLSGTEVIQLCDRTWTEIQTAQPKEFRFAKAPTTLVNVSLGMGVVSDFLWPAAIPISSVLLTWVAWPNFRRMAWEIRRRQPGMGTLYMTILVATVASGSFLAATLMGWFFRFWENRYRVQLFQWYDFLDRRQTCEKILLAHGVTDAAAVEQMRTWIHQTFQMACERPMLRGESFAQKTVLPTLTASSIGLVVGDLTMMLAILRPDYASGPGMVQMFGFLHDFQDAMREGIVPLHSQVFERIALCDWVWIERLPSNDHDEKSTPFDQTLKCVEQLATLRPVLRFGLVATAQEIETLGETQLERFDAICTFPTTKEPLVADAFVSPVEKIEPDVKTIESDMTEQSETAESAEAAESLRWFREISSKHAVYIGNDRERFERLQQAVDFERQTTPFQDMVTVAEPITSTESTEPTTDWIWLTVGLPTFAHSAECGTANVATPQMDTDTTTSKTPDAVLLKTMDSCVPLWKIACERARTNQKTLKYTWVPNSLCVAGAFLGDFTSLTAVVITNMASWHLFERHKPNKRKKDTITMNRSPDSSTFRVQLDGG